MEEEVLWPVPPSVDKVTSDDHAHLLVHDTSKLAFLFQLLQYRDEVKVKGHKFGFQIFFTKAIGASRPVGLIMIITARYLESEANCKPEENNYQDLLVACLEFSAKKVAHEFFTAFHQSENNVLVDKSHITIHHGKQTNRDEKSWDWGARAYVRAWLDHGHRHQSIDNTLDAITSHTSAKQYSVMITKLGLAELSFYLPYGLPMQYIENAIGRRLEECVRSSSDLATSFKNGTYSPVLALSIKRLLALCMSIAYVLKPMRKSDALVDIWFTSAWSVCVELNNLLPPKMDFSHYTEDFQEIIKSIAIPLR